MEVLFELLWNFCPIAEGKDFVWNYDEYNLFLNY